MQDRRNAVVVVDKQQEMKKKKKMCQVERKFPFIIRISHQGD